MRKHKLLPSLLFSLIFCGWSAAAHAATADFAGNCVRAAGSNTVYCAFDALRDTVKSDPSVCPGSSITQVFWDFGDGTPVQLDDTYITKTYSNVHLTDGAVTVTAVVSCADNTVDDKSRPVVFVQFGTASSINMNIGWN